MRMPLLKQLSLRLPERGGFGVLVACLPHILRHRRLYPRTLGFPSQNARKKHWSERPARVSVLSSGSLRDHPVRSPERSGVTRQPEVETSTIARSTHNGMLTVRRNGQKRASSSSVPPRETMCKTGCPAAS